MHASDDAEAQRGPERPPGARPDGERPGAALWPPDPLGDPAGPVAVGSQRAPDLGEDILGCPQAEQVTAPAWPVDVYEQHISAAVRAQ